MEKNDYDVMLEKVTDQYILLQKDDIEGGFYKYGSKYKKEVDVVKALYDRYLSHGKAFVMGESINPDERKKLEDMINETIIRREKKKRLTIITPIQ